MPAVSIVGSLSAISRLSRAPTVIAVSVQISAVLEKSPQLLTTTVFVDSDCMIERRTPIASACVARMSKMRMLG